MATAPIPRPVPVNLITGFLGAGKTSAIRALLAARPAGERWAVLVNEFGEVGIDGASLAADGGAAVREVAGGCVCCTARVALRVALTRLLREARPQRLLIEPTGLGHPAGIRAVLAEPALAAVLALRATICLVDPRQFADPRLQASETYRDQLALADVVVVNKRDLAGVAQTARMLAAARDAYPPKAAVVSAEHGAFDPALLDLVPGSGAMPARVSPDQHGVPHHAVHADAGPARGWRFPGETRFDAAALAAALNPVLRPDRFIRVKGIFRTGDRAQLLDYAGDTPVWRETVRLHDSRVDAIAAPGSAPDWEAFASALAAGTRGGVPVGSAESGAGSGEADPGRRTPR